MNRLGQLGLILVILLLGDILQVKFNIPVPATILSMIVLFILMLFKIIKLKWVEDIGNTLLDNLSLLFIPAGVGIGRELHIFKGNMLSLAIIIFISTTVVIVVTGYTVQALEKNKRSKKI
ncbi:MAG: CidA/LrgA family protein [Tissierella sp.]|uniref:CidA/LrgA family protein n=1 Tax=Tissierella sp. TaxID=41274 RepID=UPI003F9A3B0F